VSDGSGFFVGLMMGSIAATLIALVYVPHLPWVVEQNTRSTMKEAYDRGYADAVITDDEMVQFKWK
jgi:hypothetical protein